MGHANDEAAGGYSSDGAAAKPTGVDELPNRVQLAPAMSARVALAPGIAAMQRFGRGDVPHELRIARIDNRQAKPVQESAKIAKRVTPFVKLTYLSHV